MRSLHNKSVRVATWIGRVTPDPKQTAYIEKAMEDARSWLWYGQRHQKVWQLQRLAPMHTHLLQAS